MKEEGKLLAPGIGGIFFLSQPLPLLKETTHAICSRLTGYFIMGETGGGFACYEEAETGWRRCSIVSC